MQVLSKAEAIEELKKGFPIIFQTDTLPAIACLPKFSESIYQAKHRDKKKALILMGSELSQIINYVDHAALEDVNEIGKKYWPGPLTLVIPISANQKLNFISKDNTLGIRIPRLTSAQSLINEIGPLATSSANISGLATSFNAISVSKELPNINILGPVPWSKCSGKASTIIAWVKKGKWQLIREGEIPTMDII